MTVQSSQIRIAIVGGGLAGATLANALGRLPHVAVQVFEAAPQFSERGAAVGLSRKYLAALDHIFPSGSELLDRAGAVHMNSVRMMVGSGPHAGALIFETPDEHRQRVVHRASFLRELLAPLPAEVLHANKQLEAIEQNTDEVVLTFKDGSKGTFDAVIGADGIFGTVRSHVLGDAAAKLSASPAGFWDCRALVPMAKAKELLGAQYFESDRQYGWNGDGGFIMHDVLENRTLVQCVMSAVETNPSVERSKPLTKEFLTDTFSSWLDGPIAKGMIEIFAQEDNPKRYSQWHHNQTSAYARGRVCITGDAAHATTPWQASGAGMAIEDAMVLAALLGAVTSPTQIDAAFKAFDAVRRPRCQRIIESSYGTGRIICGRGDNIGVDVGKMREALPSRWDYIESIDLDGHKQEALDAFRELREKQ